MAFQLTPFFSLCCLWNCECQATAPIQEYWDSSSAAAVNWTDMPPRAVQFVYPAGQVWVWRNGELAQLKQSQLLRNPDFRPVFGLLQTPKMYLKHWNTGLLLFARMWTFIWHFFILWKYNICLSEAIVHRSLAHFDPVECSFYLEPGTVALSFLQCSHLILPLKNKD